MKIKAAMEALGNIIYLLQFMYFYMFGKERMPFTYSNEWFVTYIILDTMLWVKLTKDFSIHSRKSLTKQVKLQHKTHRLWGNSNYENLQIINLTNYLNRLLARNIINHFIIIFYVQGKWIGWVYHPTYLKHLLQSYLELQQPTLGRKLLLIIQFSKRLI